ncbi:MAG: response regulator with putative antiterminator output domain [Acidimicrobiales bacterium]|nr:response regulator with putative antiterminator output domain [Acidimicrobiales bacterium]
MFERVARSLAVHHGVQETLAAIISLAVENVAGCEFAGITILERRTITSPVATDAVPRIVDAIQAEVDEGPCLDAIREHRVFLTADLTLEERWPRFATRAHRETGVTSILSIRLFVERSTLGALNLYSTAADAFDDTDIAVGSVFAAHAAVALSSAQREADLERKAASRNLIGEAKGILMARSNIDEDQAFHLLRRASQRLNIKLTAVADQLVHPLDAAQAAQADQADQADQAEPPSGGS